MAETTSCLLARLAVTTEPSAWAALVERHLEGMRRSAAAAAGSSFADDAVQEALLQVRERARLFHPPTADDGEQAAGAWLRTIAANCALKLARSARRRLYHEQQEPVMATPKPDAGATLASREEEALLRYALAELPERERRPIVLRYFVGVVEKERLGTALGCSPDAAGMRLHRAMERLRARLARLGVVAALAVLVQRLEAAEASGAALGTADPHLVQTCRELLTSPATSTLPAQSVIPRPEDLLMRFALIAASLLIIAGLIGFGLGGQESDPAPGPAPVVQPAVPPVPVAKDVPWTPPTSVKDGIDRFSAALYRSLAATPGNLAVSPFSVHAALAMTSAGARGQTLAEMEHAIQFPAQERLHADWKALRTALTDVRKGPDGKPLYAWNLSNALFGQKGYAFVPAFIDLCRDQHAASIEAVDFTDTAQAVKTINDWASAQTAGRIPEIVAPIDIPHDTRLVLANAVYLKATWETPFPERLTADRPFHRPGGPDATVATMHCERQLGFAETDRAQIVALPYQGRLSMVLVVPKAIDGLAAIDATLDGPALAALAAASLESKLVSLALPRLRLAGDVITLNDHLIHLGMQRAFTTQADYVGISSQKPPLTISKVLHRCFLVVNERGSEAAAAAAVLATKTGRPEPSAAPIVVQADRPFLLLIRHQETGAILFMARVADPSQNR